MNRRGRAPEPILTLIQLGKWDTITKRLSQKLTEHKQDIVDLTHPSEEHGWYPLHWACFTKGAGLAKRRAMKAIVNACASHAGRVDSNGSTPLHILLHNDLLESDVLKFLINAYPDAIIARDCCGRVPIFHAVEHDIGGKLAAFEVLCNTENAAESLLTPCDTKYPNFRHSNRFLFGDISSHPPNERTPLHMMWSIALDVCTGNKLFRGRERKKKVEKAMLFLECAYSHRVNGSFDLNQRRRRRGLWKMTLAVKERQQALENPKESMPPTETQHLSLRDSGRDRAHTTEDVRPCPQSPIRKSRSSHDLSSYKVEEHFVNTTTTSADLISNDKSDKAGNNRPHRKPRNRRRVGSLDAVDLNEWDFDNHITDEESSRKKKSKEMGKKKRTQFRVLHAAVSLFEYLPEEVLDSALTKFRGQLKQREERTGDMPLHSALRQSNPEQVEKIVRKILATKSKTAAYVDAKNTFPLHIALSNRHFHVIEMLYEAFPSACDVKDPSTGLFPFAMPDNGLNLSFHLLTEYPDVLRHL